MRSPLLRTTCTCPNGRKAAIRSFAYRADGPRRSRLATLGGVARLNNRNVRHRADVFQQMGEADYVGIINAVAAFSAHELNVSVSVMNEDKHRSAAQDMGARDGRFVLSVGIARELDHSDKLQARC